MKNIESTYRYYEDLLQGIGKEKIEDRYSFYYESIMEFINRLNVGEKVKLNERILLHAVLEYFEDIEKVKATHPIEHVNSIKVYAYGAYWFLRRKPIQIITEDDDDEALAFINEKFVLSILTEFMTHGEETKVLNNEQIKTHKAFLNSLFYYLKFRKLDAQSLEILLLAFFAGKSWSMKNVD